MNNYFIILASGQSKRFNSKKLKQFIRYKNKALFEHSVEKAINSKLFKKIILVTNRKKQIKNNYHKNLIIIKGGKERSDSSLLGLKYIKKFKPNNVLIHDAARPNFSLRLLDKLDKELRLNDCVVPAIKTNDSVKHKTQNKIINLKRENIYLTQTPQAFNYKKLYELQNDRSVNITDDANLFISAGKKIKFINGEIFNQKITINSDIKTKNLIKYGIGFDVHRLVPNRKLYLGGIKIPSKIGTLGHSDGDPVLHALTDALLGACGKGDIGEKFSDKNNKFKNIRSTILLNQIVKEISSKKFIINNIDINIITQKPKIKKYKNKMISCISKLCKLSNSQINIKGKTTEKLGLIGKEKAIASEVIASVIKYD